jgi:hypothetical protein
MARRLKLHEELCEVLGNRNVYYQPPSSVYLKYPCIKYTKSGIDNRKADNKSYKLTSKYELILIVPNPDSDIVDEILAHFQMCSFDRWYAADGLNHYVFTLYY